MENDNVLELVARQPDKVVLKVNAADPLTVALNPEFSSDMAYITVTRGEKLAQSKLADKQ